jgi:hypothetical protein
MPPDQPWLHVRVWPDRPDRSMREVTMPTDHGTIATVGLSQPIVIADGRRWDSYEADLFGLDIGPPPASAPGRLWFCPIGSQITTMQIWRMTARYSSSPVRAEWRWTPSHGRETAIIGPVSQREFKEDIEKARQGFDLLLSVRRTLGRPEGTKKPNKLVSKAELIETVHAKVYAKAGQTNLRNYLKKTIATWMGVSLPTLRQRLEDHGYTWDDLLERRI